MNSSAKAKQTKVNEIPLSPELQKDLDRFLQGINAEENTEAYVIIFRPGQNKGTVNVNVASWELDGELEKDITDAIHKAVAGKALFYEV